MAMYFEVLAHVGDDLAAAEAAARSMAQAPEVHSSLVALVSLGIWSPQDNWVRVVPRGLGYAVPADDGRIEPEQARVAALHAVYQRLRSLPSLAFACSGYELSDSALEEDRSELTEFGQLRLPSQLTAGPGCVIPEDLLSSMPEPARFERFCEGRLWDPRLELLVQDPPR